MKHYLMVDLGTGNSRVALVDSDGGILGLRTYTNVYHRDLSVPQDDRANSSGSLRGVLWAGATFVPRSTMV